MDAERLPCRAAQASDEPGERAIGNNEQDSSFWWRECNGGEREKFGPARDRLGGHAGFAERLNAESMEGREAIARQKLVQFQPESAMRVKPGRGRRASDLGRN